MSSSATRRYALYGALFGLAFPVVATIADALFQGLAVTPSNLIAVQARQPLHWIINTAPFFLGLFAALAGRRQDELAQINTELDQRVAQRTAELEIEFISANIVRKDTGDPVFKPGRSTSCLTCSSSSASGRGSSRIGRS